MLRTTDLLDKYWVRNWLVVRSMFEFNFYHIRATLFLVLVYIFTHLSPASACFLAAVSHHCPRPSIHWRVCLCGKGLKLQWYLGPRDTPHLQSSCLDWESHSIWEVRRACYGDRGVTGTETKTSVHPSWSYTQATRALLVALLHLLHRLSPGDVK